MTTPHFDARPGSIAETVLFPGDPLRARHMAMELLEDVTEVNSRRNMLGYTGHYRGLRVSVIGSGMGIPSSAIYATELANVYGVTRIVRIGTCAGVGDVDLGDLVLAQSASTDSRFNRIKFGGHDLAATADFELLCAFAQTAMAQDTQVRVGNIFSTDSFHDGDPRLVEHLLRHRICAVEMESAGLYGLSMRAGIQAVSLLSVSDHLQREESIAAEQREQGQTRMARLALDSLVSMPRNRHAAVSLAATRSGEAATGPTIE